MSPPHPLDHAVWSALTGRQARVALAAGGARRFDPAFGVFAAMGEGPAGDLTGLAALVAAHGDAAMLEEAAPSAEALAAAGLAIVSQDLGVQMTAERLTPGPAPDFEIVALGEADGPEMLALARLTEPGPFFARTHQLGDFFGVRAEGRLVAMAGERLKPEGHTEVSGVCAHPDHRGRGYAGALMRRVAGRILDRGETPFLHAYASNAGAIALYERFGFRRRRTVWMTRVTAATG